MIQMAQREHKLTKPPVNGVRLCLPKPLPEYDFGFWKDTDDDEAFTLDNNKDFTKAVAALQVSPQKASSLL